jgi:hypothetical protein
MLDTYEYIRYTVIQGLVLPDLVNVISAYFENITRTRPVALFIFLNMQINKFISYEIIIL